MQVDFERAMINAACWNFLILCAWSSVPVFVTTVTKNFCEALSRPWVPFGIVIAGVSLNVGLNWILIYGNLGAPAMGLDGAGVATLVRGLPWPRRLSSTCFSPLR